MEWFGATRYGVQDPIKDMMKTDYLEPRKPKDLVKVYESSDFFDFILFWLIFYEILCLRW